MERRRVVGFSLSHTRGRWEEPSSFNVPRQLKSLGSPAVNFPTPLELDPMNPVPDRSMGWTHKPDCAPLSKSYLYIYIVIYIYSYIYI